ncbi:MAG: type IV toxin-antitoxin system AbiEi family antitoxin domain-containing protein [Candidatus Thermoplasmatota archaeon]
MKEREFAEFVRGVPLLTTRQVAAWLGDAAYAKLYLHRMVARGVVKRLSRGLYTAHDDPVIYASHVHYPSYISLWHAFQHHGATTQLPKVVEVMARRSGRLEGVEFVRTRHLWGYGSTRYLGFQISIAELEKAVLDAVQTGRIPLDDVGRAIGRCEPSKIEEYALRFDVVTAKKLGYIAEGAGVFLGRLHERVRADRNYVHLGSPVEKNRWKVVE